MSLLPNFVTHIFHCAKVIWLSYSNFWITAVWVWCSHSNLYDLGCDII